MNAASHPSANPQADLESRLRAIGAERYHHRHPFHLLMHAGKLSRGQLQAWALNRYCYQSLIPIKDAIILSRSPDAEFRRTWRKRILDQDGDHNQPGGLEKWLRLAVGTGLEREQVRSQSGVLPGVKFAVQAYLDLVSQGSLLTAVASSLTELFARDLIALRLDCLREHYPWLRQDLDYFEARLSQAPADARFALAWVSERARTPAAQELALSALRAKCDILWAQLDALYAAYVSPGWPPPGAFRPQEPAS